MTPVSPVSPVSATPTMPGGCGGSTRAQALRLNSECHCLSFDRAALRQELEQMPDGVALADMLEADRPHLFSGTVVFASGEDVLRMAEVIAAIETVIHLPQWRAHVLQHAPPATSAYVARHGGLATLAERGGLGGGVFLGYDFHLPEDGSSCPQLIEINTNAGGGLLNALLARAQRRCCAEVNASLPGLLAGGVPEDLYLAMFRTEWHKRRGATALGCIAIVDETPGQQYLYPEFLLFQHLFERHGLRAIICPPHELQLRDGRLWHGGQVVDMVYNRLTDFALQEPAQAVLQEAWQTDAVVLSPDPLGHALYADKRNLIALSDDGLLADWGVAQEVRALLARTIPRTEAVSRSAAEQLWARRKQLFFKPASGYGSKAAYRGDKLTRRVFDDIMAAADDYVVQALAPPSARAVDVDGMATQLKLDLRNYVYDGWVQLVSARLWQGQTTNFRTPGGGFAPVLMVPAALLTPVAGSKEERTET